MKKAILFFLLVTLNTAFSYLIISVIYSYHGFDKVNLIKALIFSILITSVTMIAMTRGKK
jgi:hypothetical protein